MQDIEKSFKNRMVPPPQGGFDVNLQFHEFDYLQYY